MSAERQAGERGPMFVATVGAVALVSGLILWLLTIAASRSRISGTGWSLSGNGALIVPFGIGPALIAGGWAAIILRLRGHREWLRMGLLAVGVGVLCVVLSLLSLIVLGRSGGTASLFFEAVGLLWLVVGPTIALLLPIRGRAARRPMRWSVGAALLLPIALLAGCQAGASVLPS